MHVSNVILVDEQDRQTGIMEKMEAHEKGVLHRAFSVFILNKQNQMLLQKRASSKYHSPGLWTNACCSHPNPDELTSDAADRRLREEMGFNCSLLNLGSFIYRTEFDNGLIEYELDHIFLGRYDGSVNPDKTEVEDYNWFWMEEIDQHLGKNTERFTSWFRIAYPLIKHWLEENQDNTSIN